MTQSKKNHIAFGYFLRLIVAVHLIVVFTNFIALIILPFMTPWYVAIPLVTFLSNLVFNNWNCALTQLENSVRIKIGKPKIRSFVRHYLINKKWDI
jgi:hypothetical protein